MSERSEFFAPRLTRAPQGIRPFGPDGGLGDSVFGYFFHEKSNSHQLGKAKRRNAFDFQMFRIRPSASEAGGAIAFLTLDGAKAKHHSHENREHRRARSAERAAAS